MNTERARHCFKEHTGEVELEVDAPNVADAFAEAARALCALVAGDAALGPLQPPERVVLRARDAESLLADWINELVALGEIRKQVYPEITIEELSLSEFTLRARVRGAVPAALRTPVKAASLHRLLVRCAPDGVHARVVLDV